MRNAQKTLKVALRKKLTPNFQVRSELRGPVPPPPGAGHNGHGMPPNSAPPSRSQIQFILDENTHLIECIINYQQKGKLRLSDGIFL